MSTHEAAGPENVAVSDAMTAGRNALREGAWGAVIDAFTVVTERAAAGDSLAAEAWEGVGLAAYWRDDATRAIEAHERAFAAYRRMSEPAAAARMALWLADDHLSFFSAGAVANGWVEQAERLLEEVPDAPERAWLPIYQGHCALQDYDTDRALSCAAAALERARALRVPQAEVVALALEGLALVLQGDVEVGMPRLDEASAAAATRELTDLTAIAWAFCYLIHGCDTIRDFARAAEWCERAMAFCERWGLGPIFTSCRARYASVLTWRGEWVSAEHQIEKILVGQAGISRPPAAARSALIRLAELRRRQGRLDEAEAMFQQAGEHRAALLGRAAIAWARGEPDVVIDLADRVLRRLPRDARAERTDALLLRILASARLGEIEHATADLRELSDTAERLGTEPLLASAAHARAAVAVAKQEPAVALAAFEDALMHYDAGGAPQEAAQIRLGLAELLLALGRDATARREAAQARDEFERLGAMADLRRAEVFLHQPVVHGSDPGGPPALPLTERELEVLRLVSRGLSNDEVAKELFLSPHTVKRHIANTLRKLECPSRAAAVARASHAGVL